MSSKDGMAWQTLVDAQATDTLEMLKFASTPGLSLEKLVKTGVTERAVVRFGERRFVGKDFIEIIKHCSFKFAVLIIGGNDEYLFDGEGEIKEKAKCFLHNIKSTFDHWSFKVIFITTILPRGSANPELDQHRRDVEQRKAEFNIVLQSLVKSQANFHKTQGGFAALRVIDMSAVLSDWDKLDRSFFCSQPHRSGDFIHFNAKVMAQWVILLKKGLESVRVPYKKTSGGKFKKSYKKISAPK